MVGKEWLRDRVKTNSALDKMWHILWWADVRRRVLMYTDFDFALKLWRKSEGREPNLKAPITLNEKLWLLKLSDRNPLLVLCSDKHAARGYVADCGYADILKKEYGCYGSADDIDFASLPSPCYLKLNNASGMNLVWRRDSGLDVGHIKWKLNYLLRQNPYWLSREWNYKDIPPRIVCEEVIEMPGGGDVPELQFFCFNGEPRFIMYNMGFADEKGHHKKAMRWVFDMDYNVLEMKTSQDTNDFPPPKPKNYNRMVEISRALSSPFPHVRVDLFNVEGRIYFNEMTFYSGGGFVYLEPKRWQEVFGGYLDCGGYEVAPDVYERHGLSEIMGRSSVKRDVIEAVGGGGSSRG